MTERRGSPRARGVRASSDGTKYGKDSLILRLNVQEHAMLARLARSAGTTLSDMARRLITDAARELAVLEHDDIAEALYPDDPLRVEARRRLARGDPT